MGNYQSRVDEVAKEVQKKIYELDVVRELNRMAVDKVEEEPHRLEAAPPVPEGIDGFEAAKKFLAALSQELRSKTQSADAALKRGDSLTAAKLVASAQNTEATAEPVTRWVRTLADVAFENSSEYAAHMSQKAIITVVPAPVRYTVLCVGHTCCLPYWDSRYDKWLW